MTFQTSVNAFLFHPAVQAIGWALLHFLWQGAVLAAIVFLVNASTRNSQTRYAIGCLAMLAMPVVFTLTALRNGTHPAPVEYAAFDSGSLSGDWAVSSEPANSVAASPSGSRSRRAPVAMISGWMVCLWLGGVGLLSLNMGAGWLRMRRLKRCGLEPVDLVWIETMQDLMRRLQMSGSVRLFQSTIAEVPAVIGWLQPYILLSAGAVSGLQPAELQAILAHELAHIRRHDYLVNLLQNVVETLLFYHPAVWWVSRCVRQEREKCCDDVAVAVCGDVMMYAEALTRLEEMRGSGIGEPALAATGGDLLARIRRLTMPGPERRSGSAGVLMAAALVMVASICAGNMRAGRADLAHAPQQAAGITPSEVQIQPPVKPIVPEAMPTLVAQQRPVPPPAPPLPPPPAPPPPPPPPPQFDAAAVKLDTTGMRVGFNVAMRGGPGTDDPGRFSITRGQPLKMMIARAWDIPVGQVFGPSWLDDVPPKLYTISATMPPDTSKERFLLMWQNLLIERFHLALHHETREFSGYDLVVAPGGAKVKEWVPDPNTDQAADANPMKDAQGFPVLRPGQTSGFNIEQHDGSTTFRGTYRQSMADFAKGLGIIMRQAGVMPSPGQLARIADKTGLAGVYQFRFQYEGGLGGAAAGAEFDTSLSFFTEIQNQLGLKLVKAKGVPMDVVVIDKVDKMPTDN